MNKRLMDYIREKEECNYFDIADVYKDLQNHTHEQGFSFLMDILLYIEHQEKLQDIEDTVLEVEDMEFK